MYRKKLSMNLLLNKNDPSIYSQCIRLLKFSLFFLQTHKLKTQFEISSIIWANDNIVFITNVII